jgi:hypothetical protein
LLVTLYFRQPSLPFQKHNVAAKTLWLLLPLVASLHQSATAAMDMATVNDVVAQQRLCE